MTINKKRALKVAINLFLFVVLLLFQYNSGISIKIAGANPLLPLALLFAVSMFVGELSAALIGLAVGVYMDGITATPVGFNAIILFLLALLVSLTVKYLFNNNIRSAIAVCLIATGIYFAFRWLLGFAFSGIDISLGYLTQFALPSTLYTSAFMIPFYYLEKYLLGR